MTIEETEKLIKRMITPGMLQAKILFKVIRDVLEQSGTCDPHEFDDRIKAAYAQFGEKYAKQIRADLTQL